MKKLLPVLLLLATACAAGRQTPDLVATLTAIASPPTAASPATFASPVAVTLPGATASPSNLAAPASKIPQSVSATLPVNSVPQLENCKIFPADNVWNTPVDRLPVDPNSAAYIQSIGPDTNLHADFGSGKFENQLIGIPYNLVSGSQPKVKVTFEYADESDPGPYPIPENPQIEDNPGDAHILIVDTDNCILYELYAAHLESDGWHAGTGAIFNLNSQGLRPEGWTSADAAGLPILPGLARYDEVVAGEIDHALRFTVKTTRKAYIWPARHFASDLTDRQYPPMGQRFRLKADYDIRAFSAHTQVLLQAMKKYGLILADNGSNWFITGTPDIRWDNDLLHQLGQVPGSAFEAVDVSSLMIDPNSAQVQPTK